MEEGFPGNDGNPETYYVMKGDAVWKYARPGKGPEREQKLFALPSFDFKKWKVMVKNCIKKVGPFPRRAYCK